jgi:hypothetical protein
MTSSVRVLSAVISVGLVVAGCEGYVISSDSTTTETASPEPMTATTPASPEPVTPTKAPAVVLNDDPNCDLVLKRQGRDMPNEGQVRYLKRVLVSDPFEGSHPVCVQYNDTQSGEVTVWKDLSSRGQRVDQLPSDRGIDKIVVWYN